MTVKELLKNFHNAFNNTRFVCYFDYEQVTQELDQEFFLEKYGNFEVSEWEIDFEPVHEQTLVKFMWYERKD